MTVAELIEQLRKHPQDMRVVVDGYESGVDDAETVEQIPIRLNCNTAWYFGSHEQCPDDQKHETALRIG